jgi:multicomponent Na+:H+ antiporter subunit E
VTFLWHVVLAVAWMVLTGEFTAMNLLFGFVLGFLVLLAAQPVFGGRSYYRKATQAVGFACFFLWELIVANLRVAYDVITPGFRMKPAVVALPLDVKSDEEITLLANLISLTPGTLSLDVSTDRKVLYIHALYVGEPEKFRRELKEGFERRVMELFR